MFRYFFKRLFLQSFSYNITWRYFEMPKSETQNQKKRNKHIKNIFIHKINGLLKIMGDGQPSLTYLQSTTNLRGKTRKSISSESQEQLRFKRKENNKDAARKARLRKKIYMQLLEQTINNLQKLNQQGKQLEKSSNQHLQLIKGEEKLKVNDQIGIYLIETENQLIRKDESKMTMQLQRDCSLNKIIYEIEKIIVPQGTSLEQLEETKKSMNHICTISRIQEIQQQVQEIIYDSQIVCSEHNSLLALSKSGKAVADFDPYFCKTLMEQYYSKTLCKKDVLNIEVSKQVSLLTKMEKYCMRASEIEKCNFLQQQ